MGGSCLTWICHLLLWSLAEVMVVSSDYVMLGAPIKCVQCDSQMFGDDCTGDNFVFNNDLKRVECSYGSCYTTVIPPDFNGSSPIAYRGCTNDLEAMPYSLPGEGCYDWKGAVICICATTECNIFPMDKTSGTALDEHLTKRVDLKDRGPVNCFQCLSEDDQGNVYDQCPKYGLVKLEKTYNGPCNSTCFTRSFHDNPTRVARGCSDTQWGLPNPLPPDGCYTWEKGTWCLCNSDGCNGKPIGVTSGKNLDDHLYENVEDFEEPDGINRCYECINYDDQGNFYKQCPKDDRVRNAYYSECNGTCFTRSYGYDDKKVARGCTATQWGLPDPLPPDGCYTWYSDVWCVCSASRCNRNPIGKGQDIEFDAHIAKANVRGAAESNKIRSATTLVMTSFVSMVTYYFHHHYSCYHAVLSKL